MSELHNMLKLVRLRRFARAVRAANDFDRASRRQGLHRLARRRGCDGSLISNLDLRRREKYLQERIILQRTAERAETAAKRKPGIFKRFAA